ncbi:MAG: MauE/DoxX family redox-associated membrane protein [Bryobacteraceae bacterium]
MTEDKARWERVLATTAAVLLGLIFLVSGGWKVLSPFKTGELLEQAQVPAGLGVLGAVALGTVELLAACLLFMPRFRRWGGLLGSGLLIFFIGWIAYYYHVLVGHECSCFPLIKRTIGPGFFIGDGVMLLLALAAFHWSPRVPSLRVPAVAFLALVVFAGVSFGVNAAERHNAQVPTPVVVDGKPQDLTQGKVFLFFYDPSCMHCDAASKFMSKLNWGDTKIVAIPTVNPQWAGEFLHDTHLKASTSLELAKLKNAFPFVDPPFGVALEDGRVKKTFGQAQFYPPLPEPDLKKLGLVK